MVFNAHPKQHTLSKIPPQPLSKSGSTDTNQQQEKPMIVSYLWNVQVRRKSTRLVCWIVWESRVQVRKKPSIDDLIMVTEFDLIED